MRISMRPMSNRYYSPVALFALLLVLLLASACHSSIVPSESEAASCSQTVRITATVTGYSNSSTRAIEPTEKDPKGTFEKESKNIATDNEGRIFYATLFVLNTDDNSVVAKKTFYNPALYSGFKTEETAADFVKAVDEGRAFPFDVVKGSELTMSIDLEPATYRFLVVANNLQVTTEALAGETTNYLFSQALEHETAPLYDYVGRQGYGDFWRVFSFVGAQELEVKPLDEVQTLEPEIDLERTHARLQISLTTAKDGKYLSTDKDGYIYTPERYRLSSVVLHASTETNKLYPYTLLPLTDETSVVPVRHTQAYTPPTINQEIASVTVSDFSSTINKSATEGLKMLESQHLFTEEGKDSYYYLPPIFGVEDKSGAVAVDLTLDPIAEYQGEFKSLTYRIYLHNEKDATDYYSVRRNTIYHLDLTFYGDRLVSSVDYEVRPWTDVDIPAEL